MSPPNEFDTYSLVLLVRGDGDLVLTDDALMAIQQQHLAHLAAKQAEGVLAVAGPLSDQPDESLRGICLYRCDLEEARRHAEADPAVQAGRLRVEVMRWWTAKGALAFPPVEWGDGDGDRA